MFETPKRNRVVIQSGMVVIPSGARNSRRDPSLRSGLICAGEPPPEIEVGISNYPDYSAYSLRLHYCCSAPTEDFFIPDKSRVMQR